MKLLRRYFPLKIRRIKRIQSLREESAKYQLKDFCKKFKYIVNLMNGTVIKGRNKS